MTVSSKAIRVLQLDKVTGEVVDTFDSAYHAAKALGAPGCVANINRVANGKAKSACGYAWRYDVSKKQDVLGEQWRPFQDVHVSSYGRIRRSTPAGEHVQEVDAYKTDAPVATINGKRWPLHRLVAHVFLGMPADSRATIKLKDGNAFNPSVDNIALVDSKKRPAGDIGSPKAMRTVEQWTHDGQRLLNQFESVAEAARQLKIDRSHINKCALGTEKTAGGYTFKFA